MRIFMLSDTHFGVFPTRGEAWLEMMLDYMDRFFLPILQKHAKPGDVCIHLGDLFDNRNSINVKVLNHAVAVVEKIAAILPVYMLVGNHDMWAMTDTSVNSLAAIRNISNVVCIEKPTVIQFGKASALLLPWVHGKNAELQELQQHAGKDLLFCHSDLVGARTQVNPTRPLNRHVCDIDDFASYGRVYSGHIHIRQQIKNFTFVGAPYHIDRNDIGNQKGIYVLNTETGKESFVPNTLSPEFKTVEIREEADLEQLTPALMEKDYVDIRVHNTAIVKTPSVRTKLDRVLSKHRVARVEWVEDEAATGLAESEAKEEASHTELDVVALGYAWIDAQRFTGDPVEDEVMRQAMREAFQEADRIRSASGAVTSS